MIQMAINFTRLPSQSFIQIQNGEFFYEYSRREMTYGTRLNETCEIEMVCLNKR